MLVNLLARVHLIMEEMRVDVRDNATRRPQKTQDKATHLGFATKRGQEALHRKLPPCSLPRDRRLAAVGGCR